MLLSGKSEKVYLCSLLELSLDDLSSALRELIPTSLLSRKIYDDVELFDLSSSIRDLLLVDTKNVFLREKILKQKNSLDVQASEVDKKQIELSISTLNVSYIPNDTSQSLKILLESFHRCRKTDIDKIGKILKNFIKSYESYKNIDIYQREYARISSYLKDYRTAVQQAKIAVCIDDENPLNLFVLADCYFRSKEYRLSSEIYLKIMTLCKKIGVTDNKFLVSVNHGVFQSLLWVGDYTKIIELTDDWENHESFSALFGGYRSTAFKRTVENSFRANIDTYVEEMTKSIEVMDSVFKLAGYLRSPCIQSLKIIIEIEHAIPRLYSEHKWLKFCLMCLNFICAHHKGIIDQQSLDKNTDSKIKAIKDAVSQLKQIEIDNNPLKNISDDVEEITNLADIDPSYVEVRIYHVMKDSNIKFAKDLMDRQYYLTKDNTSSDLYSKWEGISVGTKLFVIPSNSVENGKAIPVLDIIEV